MGDRNNPIKFGPEWMRNVPNAPFLPNNQHVGANPVSSTISASAGPSGGSITVSSSTAQQTSNTATRTSSTKVLLAKQRYGREEMLALYDRSARAPQELKVNDVLYQSRGKRPLALHNSFEEDLRGSQRNAQLTGGLPGDRYVSGRGRGLNNDARGRPHIPFVRPTSTGRGSALWNCRPTFSGTNEDEPGPSLRSWSNANGGPNRPTGTDQAEWSNKFRNKRNNTSNNWRQPQTREEGDEWRSTETGRPRTYQQEKWGIDWGERPTTDKQAWSSQRRTWGAGETQASDDTLPEWATENAEACGGTFDSSGAFHGYSNDDSNVPKSTNTSYSLTRSHTQGSFVRPKNTEEGSEEWWASEKAKKLSPKRFDTGDFRFKKSKTPTGETTDGGPVPSTSGAKPTKEPLLQEIPETESTAEDAARNTVEPSDNNSGRSQDDKFNKNNVFNYDESNTFDSMMRSEMNVGEANDVRGNFQSVMITPNNSLRQKHQHLVPRSIDSPNMITFKTRALPLLRRSNAKAAGSHSDSEHGIPQKSIEDKFLDNMIDLTLDDSISPGNGPTQSNSTNVGLGTASNTATPMPNSSLQMGIASSSLPNQGLGLNNKQNIPTHLHVTSMSSAGIQSSSLAMPTTGAQTGVLQSNMQSGKQPGSSLLSIMQTGIQTGLHTGLQSNMQTGLPSGLQPNLQTALHSGLQPGQSSIQPGLQSGLQPGQPTIQPNLQSVLQTGLKSGMQSGQTIQPNLQSALQSGLPGPSGMQPGTQSALHSTLPPGQSVMQPGLQSSLQSRLMMQSPLQSMHSGLMQPIGMMNSALNASLGLPIGPGNNSAVPPMQGVQSMLPSSAVSNTNMNSVIQNGMGPSGGTGLPGYQSGGSLPGINNNIGNASMYLSQNSGNAGLPHPNDIPMPSQGGQANVYPMHGLQQASSSTGFGTSMYSNMMQHPAPVNPGTPLTEQWYYKDPTDKIQGPFTSKDMYSWYRAGFFSPSLMVRRACDVHMRPLGSYGPVVPFAQVDIMPTYPLTGFEAGQPGPRNSVLNTPSGLGLDVESLWSQPSSTNMMWMQQLNDARINNLSRFFWEQQPTAITTKSILPDEIAKEMKSEDEILAQLRASQRLPSPSNLPFMGDQPPVSVPNKIEDDFAEDSLTPNLKELTKLIEKDTLDADPTEIESNPEKNSVDQQVQNDKEAKNNTQQITTDSKTSLVQSKSIVDTKQTKQKPEKADNEKSTKNKDNNNTKNKSKKSKEEKKDDAPELKTKEDDIIKNEKRSAEPSPSKSKKEEKANKKELEKEKKEWIKEGFTIVKGPEKNTNKESKKKAEEVRAAEETERKRKEEEKLVAEEKKQKQADVAKKQQEQQQQQQQKQASESVVKKAPWSAVTNQAMQATNKDGLTLGEIQRLEREKKLEQIKEQQQMMQIIAQQQAAALAREQEMQAGLGWAKKKRNSGSPVGQSLAEIQAETRKQAVTASQPVVEVQVSSAPPINHVPWGNAHNGGFWDTPSNQTQKQTQKPAETSSKPVVEQNKIKKKPAVVLPVKKETSPAVEFEAWCTHVLASYSSKIDVPTFVGFLKDIESPYEVKDYVKCYLGDSKDSGDFARQFLEKRSKLLRVGMVTPSDDLCKPALAVNPRTVSGSDYQEGKTKKAKKNKMVKIDTRILGFSVTASEDRINVGDIDTV